MSIQTITGVPPIDFLSSGQPLSAWSISGNSQQNGTPTPNEPIVPEFCGDRTKNLFDEIYPSIATSTKYIPLYVGNGTYTLSSSIPNAGTVSSPAANIFLLSGNVGSGASSFNNGVWLENPVTQSAIDGYITIAYRNSYGLNPESYDTMLNTGSTPSPYEPYGWKIPITNAEQTVPVYLGQTQTVRRIKKLVLTGEESFEYVPSENINRFRMSLIYNAAITYIICTHYKYEFTNAYGNAFINSPLNTITFCDDYSSANNFKQYLADEYAAGTPVTVWYVLAEPTTGIVNEPLCKIGDYADTVASTNTGAPSIPTVKGQNTLTVDTTVQPSEVSITYMTPNTIAENLVRLQIARTNIATAITTKGGTLVENAGFEDFPDAISSIPTGGGISIPPFIGNTILSLGSIDGIAGEVTVTEVN